ncbi:glucose-6-phosphate dehydrogenase assembly protein OpcA [Paeniglutamicibacter cryotolerans]|uniref:Glucose-6-phosphate dehydrogenase assembly protein OpcA n=1 Tax=Paeniglutamicibacter cryotolerans TaxID=670079 RepID=A0A839QKF7_9MICC|nr:glucose-6-phosphate dehydrogenase assembly protein OpcA [Paeniglutamicibacter cryotolerans]MBB2996878.1 glucose-6-phosphate dehydrogenase assembly protein OpcA [Paeniglutamicibacter cryotolerans]
MIVDLKDTTTSKISKELLRIRQSGGVVALSRVLTLVVITRAGFEEDAIAAANLASREHPCRILVVVEGRRTGPTKLNAQIRVGGDAGASEVIVMHLSGPGNVADESMIAALLLPDAPIVAWWPHGVPKSPSTTPLGRIAHRRITDSAAEADPRKALFRIAAHHAPGDTDLAWTRLTLWRGQLASVFDQLDPAEVTAVTVTGAPDSPSTVLLAAWLTLCLDQPVTIASAPDGSGLRSVRFTRADGDVELSRPPGEVAELYQPGQAVQRISLPQRAVADCLAEEMRRLDPDEVFGEVMREGLKHTNLRSIRPSER